MKKNSAFEQILQAIVEAVTDIGPLGLPRSHLMLCLNLSLDQYSKLEAILVHRGLVRIEGQVLHAV